MFVEEDGWAPGVAETHISTVFFTGRRAYKLLKPITTSFLDFGTPEARCHAVDDEIRLNQRMAPDVYLGHADVVEHGSMVDRMIVMRRLPTARRLSTMLRQEPAVTTNDSSVVVREHLRSVARKVAVFHSQQAPLVDAVAFAGRDAVRRNWDDNVSDMSPLVGSVFDADEFDRVHRLAARYLDAGEQLFSDRICRGFVRDGHGDLTAEDIFCMDDGPRIIDCLAFDERYRIADVVADIAFLVMDVDRLAGPLLASALWDDYREFTNEHHPASLAAHYVAYRAHVRAKVAGIRCRQGDPDAAPLARSYLSLAHRHLERARRRLILVGGTPGTGKTSLSSRLSDQLGWMMIDSDGLRKELTGRAREDHEFVDPGTGIYAPEVTDRVYREAFRRAAELLERGESVIIDASFTNARHRDEARQCATDHGADLDELECTLDSAIAAQRIRERLEIGHDPSDARPEILDDLRAVHDPWPEAAHINTAGTRDDAVETAAAILGRR